MKYLIMIYGNNDVWGAYAPEDFDALIAEDAAFQAELRASGELITVGGLADPVNARTVRVRDGVPVVSDGPYLEAKEFLASFVLIDVADHERAVEVAASYPVARRHGVELWPLMDEAGAEM